MTRHLHLQVTLLATGAGGRKSPLRPGEFRTVLTASNRHFSAALHLAEVIAPGGAAVHCEATLLDPELARSFFPVGGQFELWEGGRKGYGYVLGRLN